MGLYFSIYYEEDKNKIEVFSENITHNLTKMADKAGIYECLWTPEENKFKKAKDIIPKLEKGLKDLKARPDYYKMWDASNGWGLWEHFVPFVESILDACKKYPNGKIEASR